MPRVPEDLLRTVVYIYPSERDAREDSRFGGTGFLVGASGVTPDDWHAFRGPWAYYIVTAAHVVAKGTRVLRVNTDDGFELITLEEEDWYSQKGNDGRAANDLAVCPIDIPSYHPKGIDVGFISITRCLGHNPLAVAPGDDIVMTGRFVDHGGRRRNLPVVRFGNIAMLPSEPIKSNGKYELLAFLVEMRSRGGHSGSPVIVYWDDFHAPAVRSKPDDREFDSAGVKAYRSYTSYALLGIDQGQYPTFLDLVDDNDKKIPGMRVKERSAMSVVIPSWYLYFLLQDERLTEMRRQRKEEYAKQPKADEESEAPETLNKEGFEAVLRKVTRRVEPEPPHDQGKH